MKILHITGFYNKKISYQENLLPYGERRLGNSVYILTSTSRTNFDVDELYKSGIERDGLPIIRIKTLFSIKGIPIFYVPYKLLKRINPDIIFLHDINPYTIQILLIRGMGFMRKTKFYFDCHSEAGKDNKNYLIRFYNKIFKYFFKIFDKYVHKYYGVAPECCQFIEEVYQVPKNKIKLLPLPSKLNLKNNEEINYLKTKFNIAKDKINLLHSGKLPGNKLTQIVLNAVSMLPEEKYDLIITGSIEESFYKKNQALFKKKNINFLGWKQPDELRDIISSSDILVQPGSLSNTFIDALCCGIPVILNNTPQGRYLTQNKNGELLKVNNSEDELIEKISMISSDIKEYNEKAFQVAQKFDYLNIARSTLYDYFS